MTEVMTPDLVCQHSWPKAKTHPSSGEDQPVTLPQMGSEQGKDSKQKNRNLSMEEQNSVTSRDHLATSIKITTKKL